MLLPWFPTSPSLPRDTATAVPPLSGVSWVMNGLAGRGTLTLDNLMQRVKERKFPFLE